MTINVSGDYEEDDPDSWCVIAVAEITNKPLIRCTKCLVEKKQHFWWYPPRSVSDVRRGNGALAAFHVNLAMIKESWQDHMDREHSIDKENYGRVDFVSDEEIKKAHPGFGNWYAGTDPGCDILKISEVLKAEREVKKNKPVYDDKGDIRIYLNEEDNETG